ncbi:MAG TPA: 50S ribosomal protein L9 [Flexilinea sp.]|nr:50S ribosomal protein L9 [Flexilinea sp.]
MKVLLLKDVYKLGHAGDVKKVADGYARNYLIPQGLVTMATPGAIKQADQIKQKADAIRSQLNTEMSSLFEKIWDGYNFCQQGRRNRQIIRINHSANDR